MENSAPIKKLLAYFPKGKNARKIIQLSLPVNGGAEPITMELEAATEGATVVLTTLQPAYWPTAELKVLQMGFGRQLVILGTVSIGNTFQVVVRQNGIGMLAQMSVVGEHTTTTMRLPLKPHYLALVDCEPTTKARLLHPDEYKKRIETQQLVITTEMHTMQDKVPQTKATGIETPIPPPTASPVPSLSPPPSSPQNSGEELMSLVAPLCVVCHHRPVDRVASTCGHACVCSTCIQAAQASGCNRHCMLCNVTTGKYLRIHFDVASAVCPCCRSMRDNDVGAAMAIRCGHISACHRCVKPLNRQAQTGRGKAQCVVCNATATFVKLFFC